MTLPNGNQNQNQDPIPGQTSGTGAVGDTGAPDAGAGVPLPTSQRMGASGGSVGTTDDRVTLDVPAGVFPEDVDVSVATVDDKEDMVIDEKRVSVIQRVLLEAKRPGGQDFAGRFAGRPRLSIQYTHEDLRGSVSRDVSVHGRRSASDPWQEIPCVNDRERQVITADLEHFSEYLANVAADQSIVPTIDANQSNLQTGASSVSIPIKLPPGTNGLTPKLALSYSSAGANGIISESHSSYEKAQGSWVGMGWSLDVGHIELTDADNSKVRGGLVLNGRSRQLIHTSNDQFKTQQESFLKIDKVDGGTTHGDYFMVKAKDGTKFRFGYETANPAYSSSSNFYRESGSRQDGYSESSSDYCSRGGKTWKPLEFRYNLDQIEDTSGNTVKITYKADEGTRTVSRNCPDTTVHYDKAVYANEIHYSLNDAGGYKRKVVFVTSDPTTNAREDVPEDVMYNETRRLERVETYVANAAGTWSLVRKYVFEYEYVTYASESNKKFLLLKKVTEHDGAGNALPSTSFHYAPETGVSQYEGWTDRSSQRCPIPLLTRIDNGYGGAVEYAYSAYDWAGNGGRSWRRTRQWAVNTKTTSDGVGNSFVTTYNRSAPSPTGNHVAGFATKQTSSSYPVFRGFGIVEVVAPTGHKHEHRFFRGLDDGDGRSNVNVQSYDGLTNLLDEEQYRGTEFEVVFKKAAGESGTDPIERRWTEFETKANPLNHRPSGLSYSDRRDWHVYEVYLKKQETHRGAASAKTEFTHGTYGNTTNIKKYENASDANWTRHTKREFHPLDDATGYIVGRIAQETLYSFDSEDSSSDGISQRNIQYIYDSNTAWNQTVTSPGRLTRRRSAVTRSGSTKYVDAAYEYDTYGNRTKETIYNEYAGTTAASSDPRSITIAYDGTYHTFPITVTNLVGHAASRTFDPDFGVPLTVTDVNGHVSTMTYDGFGRLKTVEGPSAGSPSYREEAKYTYGTPKATHGKTTTSLAVEMRTDDDDSAKAWHKHCRIYDGRGMIVQEYSDTERGQLVVNRHYDGRGLLVSESAPRKGICLLGNFSERLWRNNRGFKSSRTYDTLRRPVLVTLPDGETTEHRYEGWSRSLVDQNDHLKRWDSDGLGRMTKVSEYTGSDPTVALYAETRYEYSEVDELTKVTDAANNLTTISYDDLGRKTSMTDPDMGSWSYTYDAVGNLIEQTDAKSQVIEFAYDKLNRLTHKWYPPAWTNSVGFTVYDLIEFRAAVDAERAAAGLSTGGWTDPEASSIRAAHLTELRSRLQGLWTAASLGAVPQFTAGDSAAPSRQVAASDLTDLRGWLYDANSNNTSYETSSWAQSRRARALYQYDGTSAGSGKGRRTAMWDATGNSSWTYDQYGRVATQTRVVDGRSYASSYTYDALDRAREMTYPDGEALTYSYQPNLLLDGIQSSIDSLDIVSDVVYEDIGLPDSYTLGGGATTASQSFEYWKIDDASRSPFAALKSIKLSKDSTDLVNREMQYDAVGNVTKIVDGVNSETVDYTYDDLDRLLTASVPTGESFAYDTIGNMTSKAGAALDYGTTSPKHAVKSHGTTTYSYDANGSLTAKGTQTIKYDPEQRPILVQDGTSIHRATYDGDGVRRKRDDSNGTVHYLGGYERKLAAGANSSDTVTKYYSASLGALSRSVAFRRGGTLHWVGSDHLGGTIRVLDGSFTALDGMRYKPYGEDRDTGSSLNTDRKFTGQTEDETAGLYWYASRAYDPTIGRFVSPDPIVPAPANPQSLNRYSYVYNNPLGFVDPSGNSAEWFNQAWRDEYRVDHGQYPGPSDYAFREWSMTNASRGLDSSVEQWVSTNYGTTTPEPRPAPTPERRPAPTPQGTPTPPATKSQPTIQTSEAYLDEVYNDTIHPRDPLRSPAEYYGDPPSGGVTRADQEAINRYQSEKPWLKENQSMLEQLVESNSPITVPATRADIELAILLESFAEPLAQMDPSGFDPKLRPLAYIIKGGGYLGLQISALILRMDKGYTPPTSEPTPGPVP